MDHEPYHLVYPYKFSYTDLNNVYHHLKKDKLPSSIMIYNYGWMTNVTCNGYESSFFFSFLFFLFCLRAMRAQFCSSRLPQLVGQSCGLVCYVASFYIGLY